MQSREIRILGIVVGIVLVIVMLRSFQADLGKPKISEAETRRYQELHKLYPDYAVDPRAAAAKLASLARESGGDVTKVPIEAKKWLDGMTAGHASEMLAIRYRQLLAEDKKRTVYHLPQEKKAVGKEPGLEKSSEK